ncbi:hypothetical protein [Sorangium sp. So ce1000]|uniref:hypothetical protein n=1 Tax=Sorangium sp. So ce1000 TaxID=3133325 RepID=UPI003F5EC895
MPTLRAARAGDLVQNDVLVERFGDGGRVLRAWDPAGGLGLVDRGGLITDDGPASSDGPARPPVARSRRQLT